MMTEVPPELDDEPQSSDPEPGFTEHGYRVLSGSVPNSGIDERPYQQLGGLARPDAYFGALEFDCPTCEVSKGEKCHVWVERLGRNVLRKMPCLARIRAARDAGIL
jgi:hypothetical protein